MKFLVFATLVLTSSVGANNIESEAQEAWLTSVHESWAEQDSEFKNSPTSPLAGASRFELDETGVVAGDVLNTGRFSVELYPNENQITALVFDANSQQVKDFNTLERFEPDPMFAVTANIVKFESPEQVDLITGLQRIKERYKYAILEFEIEGVELELTAYKYALEGEHSDVLFVPFTDKTTGKYSYGGGRYLSVVEPEEGAEVAIDFNLVTNPLCAYTPIYNCIVPTRENRLPIAILAGEKKYH